MGCWNKTCGLTRLHITAGTPVYVFVLEEISTRYDECYSTSFYKPLLLPFESIYDDYGGGENSSGPGLNLIIEGIRSELVELEEGANKYHDIPAKKDGFNVDQFFSLVHEGRLSINRHGQPAKLAFVMIRKDAVQHIFDNWVLKEYVGEGKGTHGWGNSYLEYKVADVLADVPAFVDRIELHVNESRGEPGKSLSRNLISYRGLSEVYSWDDRNLNKVAQYTSHDSFRYSRIVHISEAVITLVEAGDRAGAEALLTEHVKASLIDDFYSMTRNVWVPGCHEGSQAQEHAGYRMLTSAINTLLDRELDDRDD